MESKTREGMPVKFVGQGEHLWMIKNELWYRDPFDKNFIPLHKVKRILADEQSEFQHILILETYDHGIVLILDGFPQMSLKSNVYPELVGMTPLLIHPAPQSGLILGGGDLDILSRWVMDTRLKKIVLVDIDRQVVELCKKHMLKLAKKVLPHIESGRVKILTLDAAKFVVESDETFDVIVIDLVDPTESALSTPLMQSKFFRGVKSCSAPGVIISMQSGKLSRATQDIAALQGVRRLLHKEWPHVVTLAIDEEWFSNRWSVTLASERDISQSLYRETQVAKLFDVSHLPEKKDVWEVIRRLRYLKASTLLAANYSIHPEIRKKLQ